MNKFISMFLIRSKVVEVLLKDHADPSLKLSNGVGSALCSATTFTAERRRIPSDRIKLVSITYFFPSQII